MGLLYSFVELREAVVDDALIVQQVEMPKAGLWNHGLELMNNRLSLIIEKVKVVIIEMILYSDELHKIKFSDYLSKKSGYYYTYLAISYQEYKA